MDLILVLAEYGYPPVTNDEVYKEILEQKTLNAITVDEI